MENLPLLCGDFIVRLSFLNGYLQITNGTSRLFGFEKSRFLWHNIGNERI